MDITTRQNQILKSIVKQYINSAQPVSSQLLEEKYVFNVSPATIRIEMQKLTEQGYLYQPHTSAGRVPSDKGYRFFVDEIFNSKISPSGNFNEFSRSQEKIKDNFKFIQLFTKQLALASSALAMSCLIEDKVFWKEGWSQLFQEPEFKNADFSSEFLEMVDNLEKKIAEFVSNDSSGLKIYIGKENPVSKHKDFGVIVSSCSFPKKKKGALLILGPKRMSYQKNVSLVNAALEILNKY